MIVQVLSWCYGCRTFLVTCRTQEHVVVELFCGDESLVAEMCIHEWVHITTITAGGRHWVVAVN